MLSNLPARTLCAIGACACVVAGAPAQIIFSHDDGTAGAPGSAVNAGPDTASIFDGAGGTNTLAADSLLALGLLPGDNINALARDGFNPAFMGALNTPFLFSVEPGAAGQPAWPVFTEAPDNPGDVYALGITPGHGLAYQESQLGLVANAVDSIDGMDHRPLAPGERVFFSLRAGSPTLLARGWSAADVLSVFPGAPLTLTRAIRADQLGLLTTDDLDAVVVETPLDADGSGVFDGPQDTANVYFSVTPGSSGMPGTDVRARSGVPGAGGDIFLSGLAGGNTLLYAGDRWIKLAPGDVLDALMRGSLDPANPFPLMTFAPPPVPPTEPPGQPPYRGIGVPIGEVYVQVCDMSLPSTVNWSLVLKLCDRRGNTMDVSFDGQIVGLGGARGMQKALIIQAVFAAAAIDKPGHDPDPLPLFSDVRINIPSTNVNNPAIVAEVCATVNQDLIDCGWDLDAVCFSMSNWTAGIILRRVAGEIPGGSRRTTYWIEDTPKADGVFGISAGNFSDPDGPIDVRFEAPFGAGDSPASIGAAMADAIVEAGGVVSLSDDGRVTIIALPFDPPPDGFGLGGPFVWEGGALENDVLVTMDAQIARTPGMPCNAADIAPPFGTLDIFDVLEFLERFGAGMLEADYAPPAGVLDIFDVLEFLEIFSAGCPPLIDA